MHSIYKITVDGVSYFGYTSRDPTKRLSEHLRMARRGWKHRSLLYPALRRSNYQYDFEVIGIYNNEFKALCKEIMLIRQYKKNLNLSPGGEGSTIKVSMTIQDGRMVFTQEPRKTINKGIKLRHKRRQRRGRKARRARR